jgi:hypothetical protein
VVVLNELSTRTTGVNLVDQRSSYVLRKNFGEERKWKVGRLKVGGFIGCVAKVFSAQASVSEIPVSRYGVIWECSEHTSECSVSHLPVVRVNLQEDVKAQSCPRYSLKRLLG